VNTPFPWICLVTDRRGLSPGARTTRDELLAVEAQVAEAIAAGVDLIQIREPDLDAAMLAALTKRLVDRAADGTTRIIVNDRADVARAAGAAGVHLRADGPPAARVRPLGPSGWTVGRSIHTPEDARLANATDYVIFGTVFRSGSKPADAPIAGVEGLSAAVIASAVPVLAIGGITPAGTVACRDAGAAGVAAIGAFFPPGLRPGALGPAEAVLAFRRAWDASPDAKVTRSS